jgi:RNA polymerase sigma-70 factor (subfamily 1)
VASLNRSEADFSTQFPDLLASARNGCKKARGQVLTAFHLYLLRLAYQEMAPELHAKASPLDLVQDTFQEAHRDFDGFKGHSIECLKSWLRSILLHNVVNFTRQFGTSKRWLGAERSLDDESGPLGLLQRCLALESSTPSAHLMRDERAEAVQAALARLSESERQVVRWHVLENRSFVEIGRLLGITADTARMRCNRALDHLREDLASQV